MTDTRIQYSIQEIEQGLIGREYLKRVRENARAGK